jgi:simple sugar transport system ATP-binding protein
MEEFNILLKAEHITKSFGDKMANNDISFFLQDGKVLGLLGENGAGKTTLMNILFGLLKPDNGKIFIKGKEVNFDSPLEAMLNGLGMVHQHFMLLRPMTVLENMMLSLKPEGQLLKPLEVRKKILSISDHYNLDVNPDAVIENLSVGEQQRVEILSLLLHEADIVILDEPTAVLTPQESEVLFDIIRTLVSEKKSIIFISHKLDEILEIADDVIVLRQGELVAQTKITSDTNKSELTDLMVGRNIVFDYSKRKPIQDELRLEVKNLTVKKENNVAKVDDINFSINKGEILAIAGVDGNGQSELCDALMGLSDDLSGSINLLNKELVGKTTKEILAMKVGYIPEDRQLSGLVMDWSIEDNLILKNREKKPYSNKVFLNPKEIDLFSKDMIKRFNISCESADEEVKSLSGGNQQKVILAREMEFQPNLLIACHPTRGLDIGASEYVRSSIMRLRERGSSVLLISADLEEIYQLADKILVMFRGKSMGVVSTDTSISQIGLMMAGELNE